MLKRIINYQFLMPNLVSLTIFTILIFLNDSVKCYKCNFFKNISVEVTPDLNDFNTKTFPTLNGCMEPKQFNTEVESVAVEKRNIGTIGDHAVHGLLQLQSLSFFNCDIRKISSKAFENLPNIQEIWITGSKLTSIEAGTFKNMPSLEIVVLYGGRISRIETGAFGEGLKELSFDENRLSEINDLWFVNSTEIISLSAKSNKIQRLNKGTFQYIPNLVHLDLSHNEIRHIEDAAFVYIKKIDVLNLGYNRLVEFKSNVVPDNFKIKKLDLSCNFLNFLSGSLLDKITVKTLILSGNPWKCSCLDKIHKWITESNSELLNNCKLYNVPYCVHDKPETVCSEKVDFNLTKSFLNVIKRENVNNCANLS